MWRRTPKESPSRVPDRGRAPSEPLVCPSCSSLRIKRVSPWHHVPAYYCEACKTEFSTSHK